ncbi:MAG: glutamate decarboxylase [Desulfobacteraceae bacterium]|nr:glutamate decarboxylase [Desulfobacteraceae bacterium]
MRETLKRLFELIDDYLNITATDHPVVNYLPPEELSARLPLTIGEDGEDIKQSLEHISTYLKYAVQTGNPFFLNQLYAGFNMPAFIGDVITSLTNTSIYTYEVAPVAVMMELELVKKMNEFTGFTDGDGTFLTGGSNANLVSMFTARNQKISDVKQSGLYGQKPLIAYVSDQAHYSFGTAANMLGLGVGNLVKIKTDAGGRMIVSDLVDHIEGSIASGHVPFFIGATAGTTVKGAFDPIDEIADRCKEYGCWLHVDGAFGGSAILSRNHRHLLNGIGRADSFAWDPHKLMNIPLICAALLVKKKGIFNQNLIALDTDYLYHESESCAYDLGKKSIQCGRRVDVLKLWLSWKYHGDAGYEKRVMRLFDLADYMAECVSRADNLELLAPVQSFTVCFRYKAPAGKDANALNKTIRDNLWTRGQCMVNYGYVNERLAIRFVAANPDLDNSHIDRFISYIQEEGARLLAAPGDEMKY